MKVSRLHIEQFARDAFPTFSEDNIAADDLLLVGGNRSGKTLTFNALLYGLYGPRATYGVSPGRTSKVRFVFNNDDELIRGGSGRRYSHGNETFEKDVVDQAVAERIGEEDIVSNQFIPSETDELPLATLSKKERISLIRRLLDNKIQENIEQLEKKREELEEKIERIKRTELRPQQEDLDEISMSRYESRLEKIEQVQSLIDSGRIETIKQRLLDNEEVRDSLEELDDRRHAINQELRKKERKLRERRRYTDEVNDIILDAISELTCPVCDQIVREQTAKRRLQDGRCPQCGRERSLDNLRQDLRSKIDSADEVIETLESEIEDLRNEKEKIENEIKTLQDSVPDLSDLNDLTIHTLKSNDYDIEAVADQTQEKIKQHRSTINELSKQKDQLEASIGEIEAKLSELEESHTATIERIQELTQESFEDIITSFRDQWSENYELMAPDLAVEINLRSDGSIILPGNDGPRAYDELSTGEVRLLNISFVYTLARQATDSRSEGHNWECIVMDEPFANIDEDLRNNTIEVLRNSNIQFVITTSNEDLTRHFDPNQVKSLNRMHIQYTLDEIEELAADD
jgi:DNA repair exonuclease SbcCD ATPase subunit